jgi:hypothetical protein
MDTKTAAPLRVQIRLRGRDADDVRHRAAAAGLKVESFARKCLLSHVEPDRETLRRFQQLYKHVQVSYPEDDLARRLTGEALRALKRVLDPE